MALDGLGFLADAMWWILELVARGLVGWRFLFSAVYRARVIARWRTQPTSMVALELTGGAAGVAISIALTAWLTSRLI